MSIDKILIAGQVIVGVLLMVAILLQTRGASLGESFGGSGVFYGTRRGPEKTLYQITIVLGIIFVLISLAFFFI